MTLTLARQLSIWLLMVVCVSLLLPESGVCIISGEKSPEEQAANDKRDATKKYNNGVKHMDKAREKAARGDSLYAFNYRATANAKARKEYQKAVKDFLRAAELLPEFAEAFNNLGYCYRKLGRLETSLTAYDSAITLNDSFEQAREYRGETFLAMGKVHKAERELRILERWESPYADTLARAIQLFRLAALNEKMQDTVGSDD